MNAVTQTIAAEPVSGVEISVPLCKLKRSPRNARKVPHDQLTILESVIDEISDKRSAYDPQIVAHGGLFVVLNHDGVPRIERGFVRPEDEALAEPVLNGSDDGDTGGDADPDTIGNDEQDETRLLALLAHCASRTVNALRLPWDRKPKALQTADKLASAIDLDMAKDWTPSVDSYLGRVTKAHIAAAVAEGVSQDAAARIADMKKPDMVTAAEQLLAGTGRLPAVLRTPEPENAEMQPVEAEDSGIVEQPSEARSKSACDTEAPGGNPAYAIAAA